MGDSQQPVIFEYDNYRRYLKDFYSHQKSADAAFSFRSFLREAGFQSSNYMKLVMEGKRNLSVDGIAKFAKALGLDANERDFFGRLVSFNQAKTMDQKQKHAGELVQSKIFGRIKPVSQSKFLYWSKWYHVAIREMVALPFFREDCEWIAGFLRPAISADEVREAIETLLRLQLLQRRRDGRLFQSEAEIISGDEVVNVSIVQFHREMIQRALESVEQLDRTKRHVSAVTVSVSLKTEEKIKEMIHKFRKEILAVAGEDAQTEKVIQLNFQLFPLTGERS